MLETASFASIDVEKATPESIASWQEMQAIQMLAEKMNSSFAEAYSRYFEMQESGQPVPIAPSIERKPSSSKIVVSLPGVSDVDCTNLSGFQRNDVTEIAGIANQQSISLEEAAAQYIEMHHHRY